jgi:hypothetical protein
MALFAGKGPAAAVFMMAGPAIARQFRMHFMCENNRPEFVRYAVNGDGFRESCRVSNRKGYSKKKTSADHEY